MMSTIDQTITLIRKLHAGQKDRAGADYYLHPIAVMNLLPASADDEVRHAALLHDVMEDCGVTADMLRAYGYSERVIAAVEAVTHMGGPQSYLGRIQALIRSGNRDAMMVKLADNKHNSDLMRCGDDTSRAVVEKLIKQRYAKSIEMLTQALGE